MIFNEMSSSASLEAVQESPYELGIGGALMHVYENECNYNAIMKAAALSEMKYYNETGGDLFVQEAGALRGLAERIKSYFKKVIEKIKSIAKKFMAMIHQFTMKDKDFVKKYQKDLLTRDLKDFEYDGYKFPLKEGKIAASLRTDVKNDTDDDDINDMIEKNRGGILGGSSMTESEFRDELKEYLYGDKESFPVSIRTELNIISSTNDLIKKAEKEQKTAEKAIEDIIKDITKKSDEISKTIDYKEDETISKNKTYKIARLDKVAKIYRAYANDITVYYGAFTKALKDRRAQAKAICVKALSYKHEAATLESSYDYNDGYSIFAGVEIV